MNPGDERRGNDAGDNAEGAGGRGDGDVGGDGGGGPEAVLRVLCERLVDALAATDHGGLGVEEAALRRVAHARRVRELAERAAEEVLDDAVLAARRAGPAGVAWARLGQVLGVSGQAVGQRLRARHPDTDLSRPARPASGPVTGWAVPVRAVPAPDDPAELTPAAAPARADDAARPGVGGGAQLEVRLTGGPTAETPPARTLSRRDRRRRRRSR